MGDTKSSQKQLKKRMKVFSLIATTVLAEQWDGVSVDNSCGMTIAGENFVNKTCTVAGADIQYIFAGNGAFINGANTFTGVDGVSGEVNVVVFFNQNEDADGNLDNSTCWDAAVSCADTGADYSGPLFMENVNDHRNAKNGNYNLQIANVQNGDALSIQLNDADGNPYAVQNISAPFGTITAEEDAWGNFYSDDGSFTVTVGDEVFGQLFQISIVQQPGNVGVLSMWDSSISN